MKVWTDWTISNDFKQQLTNNNIPHSNLIPEDVEPFEDRVIINVDIYTQPVFNDLIFQYPQYKQWNDEEIYFIFIDIKQGIVVTSHLLNTPRGEFIALEREPLSSLLTTLNQQFIKQESVIEKLFKYG